MQRSFGIFLVLTILIGLATTIYLVGQRQIFRSKASTTETGVIGTIRGEIKIIANQKVYSIVAVYLERLKDNNPEQPRFVSQDLLLNNNPTTSDQIFPYIFTNLTEDRYLIRVAVMYEDGGYGFVADSNRKNDCPSSPKTLYDWYCAVKNGSTQDFTIVLIGLRGLPKDKDY